MLNLFSQIRTIKLVENDEIIDDKTEIEVTHIYKKDYKNDNESYRIISILPNLNKILIFSVIFTPLGRF